MWEKLHPVHSKLIAKTCHKTLKIRISFNFLNRLIAPFISKEPNLYQYIEPLGLPSSLEVFPPEAHPAGPSIWAVAWRSDDPKGTNTSNVDVARIFWNRLKHGSMAHPSFLLYDKMWLSKKNIPTHQFDPKIIKTVLNKHLQKDHDL